MKCHLFYVARLLVAFAYDDLSHNKLATQSHTAAGTTFDATNAVDRNIATCMRTADVGISSEDKAVWWKVDLGGVVNIYSVNIQFKNYDGFEDRQRGRFAGFSLFVSNTGVIQGASLCYKDRDLLPYLNFSCICTESGRYVIFYNERLDGVTYPAGYELSSVHMELCEVIVQGCTNASLYGSNCDTPCPTNCKDNTCNIESGACFNCTAGWIGMYCNTECGEGWYGENCSKQCVGHCRDNTPCHHVNGQCVGGCDAGWTGSMCDKGCDDGTYGYNCVNNCSGHCLNDSPCNKQTGHCDTGCKPGYTNGRCNEVCPSQHYGINCKESCSGQCINNEPCDHISGACSNGCQDGFVGTRCSSSCTNGYFGPNCSRLCSSHCKPDTCRPTDGWCTSCAVGWMGSNCTTGDSAYPLRPYLITPFRDNGRLTAAQRHFNRKLSTSRQTVERAIGLLKCRFRRLTSLPCFDVERTCKAITTCCVLHNICILSNDSVNDILDNNFPDNNVNNYGQLYANAPTGVHRRNEIVQYLQTL